MAAMPLPSPVKPRPSVVVANSDTGAPFNAVDNAAIASLRLAANLGRLPITCTETFEITKPALVMIESVSDNNFAPLAPAYSGRLTPKFEPKSPKPVAANNESQIACAATSPSECPATPTSSGQLRQPNQSSRPTSNACASTPTPVKNSWLLPSKL